MLRLKIFIELNYEIIGLPCGFIFNIRMTLVSPATTNRYKL